MVEEWQRMAKWRFGGMAEWQDGGMAEWRDSGMAEWRGMAERWNDGMGQNGGMVGWRNISCHFYLSYIPGGMEEWLHTKST